MKLRMYKTLVFVWMAMLVAATQASIPVRMPRRRDESGSPTLETVVIAAGLLAIAIAAVLIIKTAVSHYSAQIQ